MHARTVCHRGSKLGKVTVRAEVDVVHIFRRSTRRASRATKVTHLTPILNSSRVCMSFSEFWTWVYCIGFSSAIRHHAVHLQSQFSWALTNQKLSTFNAGIGVLCLLLRFTGAGILKKFQTLTLSVVTVVVWRRSDERRVAAVGPDDWWSDRWYSDCRHRCHHRRRHCQVVSPVAALSESRAERSR